MDRADAQNLSPPNTDLVMRVDDRNVDRARTSIDDGRQRVPEAHACGSQWLMPPSSAKVTLEVFGCCPIWAWALRPADRLIETERSQPVAASIVAKRNRKACARPQQRSRPCHGSERFFKDRLGRFIAI